MDPDLVPRPVIYVVLRANLPLFAVGVLSLAIGIASLILAIRRTRERLFLWVGLFSIFYAVRLLLENELARDAFAMPEQQFLKPVAVLTYLIPIPYGLFARELFDRGWQTVFSIWLGSEILFAAIAVPAAFAMARAPWADQVNAILVIAGSLLILLQLAVVPKGSDSYVRSLQWPILIFATVVVLRNRGFAPGGFNIEPFAFLILLMGLCTTAVRRALAQQTRLSELEAELATARRIQTSIIPQSAPAISDLQIESRYQPMTAVAGDFYDFLYPGENRLTILVADVSGHGVPAALVASMLKVCFAAQRDRSSDPAAILTNLNSMLQGSLGGQYVTAACAAIDLPSDTLTYAGAGHPPSLLWDARARRVLELTENGLFLGPFARATYTNVSVPFRSGDRLLLYTDGIIEAEIANGQEFGRERLMQFCAGQSGLPPDQFLGHLFQAIDHPPQADDLTAVVVQRTSATAQFGGVS